MGSPLWSYKGILKEYCKICVQQAFYDDRKYWRNVAKQWFGTEEKWNEFEKWLNEIGKYQPYDVVEEVFVGVDENGKAIKESKTLVKDKGQENLEGLVRKFEKIFWFDEKRAISSGVGLESRIVEVEVKRRDYQCMIVGMAIERWMNVKENNGELNGDVVNALGTGLEKVYDFFGIKELDADEEEDKKIKDD